jgi:hypothetical protein
MRIKTRRFKRKARKSQSKKRGGAVYDSGSNTENQSPSKKYKTHIFSDKFKAEMKRIEDFVRGKKGFEISDEEMYTLVENVMKLYNEEFINPVEKSLAAGDSVYTDKDLKDRKDNISLQVNMKMEMLLHLLTSP